MVSKRISVKDLNTDDRSHNNGLHLNSGIGGVYNIYHSQETPPVQAD
jgi:hypothetical protein